MFADDWDHYAIEQGIYPVQIAPWDMFRWVGNGDAERKALLRAGRLPWWSSHDLKLSVLRPLPSLLAHFDYSTLDGVHHPIRLHVHTLLWWSFLLVGVAALMKQIVPLPVALLTTAMYAVDDCFIMPFAWAANRSEIIALGFMVWALSFLVRARSLDSLRTRYILAPLVSLAFLSGEHALAPFAFVVVATFAGPADFRTKARSLIPLVIIVAVYSSVRAFLGYGVAGSGFYIDPLAEPVRYLQASATRIPILLAELVFSIPCEVSGGAPLPEWAGLQNLLRVVMTRGPGNSANFVGVGVAAGLVSVACVFWLRSKDGRDGERAIAWLVVGALISLPPLAGTVASGRLTPAPAIGFDALMAYLLWKSSAVLLAASRRTTRIVSAAAAVLVLGLAFAAPMRRSYDGANYMNGMTNLERRWIEDADFGVEQLAGRDVFVLSARDLASEMSIPYILHAAGRAMPTSSTLLSPRGDSSQVLTRVDRKSFELALGNPAQPPTKFNGSVYRADADAMHAGQRVHSPRFQASVIEMRSGQPSLLRFDFVDSLDDDHLVFMVAEKHRFSRLNLPRVGESVVILPAQGP